ncbi:MULTISPECIES: cystathionine beta-lyase [unclassified Arsukibacterium]|uniref:cystathionine beta-lyase n=1 Tax=unclassified Arsukibacterium TaxID=2635278 RepID=UPI000C674FA1|nr:MULTISPECIES: cystathionine beta-lyase [unclassified Arsukibacterium]MAA95914.1 cystathionine beta-lyase [Rheinheimera sp.]MBM34782.1 cystathionine beta-lyase [Rheinheimera sp.]HAW91634.1 cystathionine beta-lyase [Candidatus Azambacteria bacterium]|tara:strand:+ start:24583 stop:25761 length:1179 start_codon:yes stop_codon:yes gene_type:complete
MHKNTKLIDAGRSRKYTGYAVNPPLIRASTIVFDTFSELKQATLQRGNRVPFYGRRGTDTHFALQEAICELEGGAGCALYPCGAAAVSGALLAFLQSGDHLLMVDSVYEPTRALCDKLLKGFGIETTYYDPQLGAGIAGLIQANTKVIFLESPGSLTFEMQDIPAICAVAQQHNIVTILDNTWASPILCQPFTLGVDISIQAATKYIVGHSDVMLGTASANDKHWPQLREHSYLMGYCASADDAYTALRGLRTLAVRLQQHEQSALRIAHWLQQRPEVETVLHPALPSHPGHAIFQRDFSGSNGLFSFVLKQGNQQQVAAFIEGMRHFKMGFSWGGYESLITATMQLQKQRTASSWPYSGPLIRLHIGLEHVDDLLADLTDAFERFNQAAGD